MAKNYKVAFNIGDACKSCGTIVTTENCVIHGGHYRVHCRECWQVKAKEYNSKRNMKHHNMMHRYGMNPDEYNWKLERQLHGCAICKQPCKTGRNLAIDHDHKTNIIRDLLCQRCNVILGLVNDDESLLFDIIEYLKRHQVREAS